MVVSMLFRTVNILGLNSLRHDLGHTVQNDIDRKDLLEMMRSSHPETETL